MEYKNDFQQTPDTGNNPYSGNGYGGSYVVVGEEEPEKGGNTFAIVSLVLGILGVIICCIPYISIVMVIVGLILGIISLAQNRDGTGMAIAGTILNGIGLILSILCLLVIILGYVNV